MIDTPRALRIAQRLARHYKREDRLLKPGMVTRLWAILETHPAAREAYGCPPDQRLGEHAGNLSPAELEAATEHLGRETRSVVSTPDEAA